MAEATANIGVIGLATMGSNLARNLAHHGNTVALFNRHYSRTEKLMNAPKATSCRPKRSRNSPRP